MTTTLELTQQGIAALKAGNKEQARKLLGQAVVDEPANEQAWLWLSGAVTTGDEKRQCLERVLAINPNNAAAQRGLGLLVTQVAVPTPAPAVSTPTAAAPADNTVPPVPPKVSHTPAPQAADKLETLGPSAGSALSSTPQKLPTNITTVSASAAALQPSTAPLASQPQKTLPQKSSNGSKASKGTVQVAREKKRPSWLILAVVLPLVLVIGAVLATAASHATSNFLVSIAEPTPVPEPTVPEIFKTQLLRFLEEAAKADAMTSQGVNYRDLKEQVSTVQASFTLIESTWPDSLPLEAKQEFREALMAWTLCLKLWAMDIDDKDNPTEPDINGYEVFLDHGDGLLTIETYKRDFIVPAYRGKKYLPFDENVRTFMSLGGIHFEDGKKLVLDILD